MRQRKTFALAALVLLALLPLTAFAERGGHHGRGPGSGMFPPPGYLDLTDEQIEATEAIRDGMRDQMRAAREERRALHGQLKAALDGDSPDAATVGQLVIDLHGMREQSRTAMESAGRQFAALLTAEQLEKWQNFKELRQDRRGSRHRGHGFGPGPDGPDAID